MSCVSLRQYVLQWAEQPAARGTSVTAEKTMRARAGKHAPKRTGAPEAGRTPPLPPERQYVDIDPWAVLLEQLMDIPEEEPAKRKPGSGK